MPQATDDTDETAFLRFAQAVLRRAASWEREQPPPTVFQRRFEFVGISEWHEPVLAIPNYEYWLQARLDEIAALPETLACIMRLWADGIFRHLLPKSPRSRAADQLASEQIRALARILLHPVAEVLQSSKMFGPPQEQVLATYARYRAAWTAISHHHVAIIPLLNFRTGAAEPCQLSRHFTISPFTDQEKSWLWGVMDTFHESGLIPFHTFMQAEFKLAAEWSLPDLNRVDDQHKALQEYQAIDLDMLSGLRNVVTALRLVKSGDVAVTGYAEHNDDVPPFGGHPSVRTLGFGWSDFQVRRHGSPYILDAPDIGEVQSFVEALALLDGRPGRAGLEVALRRFNQSYSREYYEDRLIDLTIALESTLLADVNDPKTDLKYRFVLHGAALLAGHRAPQEVHDFLRAMYDARSAVVHSGKTLSDMKKRALLNMDWRAFAQACEDITRDVLAEYIRELRQLPGSTVQSITKGLEARVVQSLDKASRPDRSGGLPAS